MTETTAIWFGNDVVLEVNGLKTVIDDNYVNDAVVTVTVVDSADTEVSGETWPLSLGYVSGSNGVYRVILQDTLSFTVGNLYTAKITANGDGATAYWECPLMVSYRR